MADDEGGYAAFMAQQLRQDDMGESAGFLITTVLCWIIMIAKGLWDGYSQVFISWSLMQVTSAVIPGLVASRMPAFFSRHREAVVMACKLLAAAGWPRFRLAWHAPGTPPDARAAFGGFSWLPVHPFGLVQTGALQMLTLSVRHALRFKAQLFCSLVMLFSVMQAEKAARLHSTLPLQHFMPWGMSTTLQLVAGLLGPLAHHYTQDSVRRRHYQAMKRQQIEHQQRQGT